MLEQEIGDIRENLQMGRYPNESAVRQGIVQRLPGALGWPIYNTEVVYPEYTLERRHVDYALCHPASKPRVFIEVKQVGQSDGAERQLFEYAFPQGVPLAVLTDGREWSFFLPAGADSYAERCVYMLDLVEHDVAKSVQRFERYLCYETVCSGAAFTAAQEDYRDVDRERQIHEALPKAWVKLVAEEDEFLIEVVAECVEGLCGHKPAPDTVARFLRTLQPRLGPLPKNVPNSNVGVTLFNEFYSCQTGKEILVKVFEALAERDPSFNEKFVALPKHGSKRRWLDQYPSKLHPGKLHRAQSNAYSHKLKSGYWLLLQVDHNQRERIIKQACEVAGISYGTDLKINNPPVKGRSRAPRETGA